VSILPGIVRDLNAVSTRHSCPPARVPYDCSHASKRMCNVSAIPGLTRGLAVTVLHSGTLLLAGQGYHHFTTAPPPLLSNRSWGTTSQGVKRTGCEAHRSPPSRTEDKNGRAIHHPLPHLSSRHSAQLIKKRDGFTFFLYLLHRFFLLCLRPSPLYTITWLHISTHIPDDNNLHTNMKLIRRDTAAERCDQSG
jgi:hypothetical protein